MLKNRRYAGWRPVLTLLASALPMMAMAQAEEAAPAAPIEGSLSNVDWGRVWEICIGGFGLVMAVLIVIALATALLNYLEVATEAKQAEAAAANAHAHPAPPAAQKGAAAAAAAPAAEADPNIAVAITAAVAVALRGRAFQVRRIQLAASPSSSWSQLGRTAIHSSHNIHR